MKKKNCAHNHNLFDLKYLICLHIRIRTIDELFQRSNTTIEPDILNRREFIIEQQPPLQKKLLLTEAPYLYYDGLDH